MLNELNYEPKRPKPRREGLGILQLFAWIVTCMTGAFAGAAAAMGTSRAIISDIACCGSVGGAVAVVLAVPLLVFAEHAGFGVKLLIGFATAFAFTGILALFLIAMASAG